MATVNWLNDNENISYPFLKGTVGQDPTDFAGLITSLPKSAVVDAGFLLSPQAGYEEGEHNIWLHQVTRSGDLFLFDFRSDAPGLVGWQLRFTRDISAARFATEYVDAEVPEISASSLSSLSDCNLDELLWTGFMISGRLDALAELLPGDGALDGSAATAIVEPTLLRNLGGSYIRTISLANMDRTRAETPEGCRPLCWEHPTGGIYIAKDCITGKIFFREGFNLTIQQNNTNRSLTFNASVGAGMGEVCEQPALFPAETPPGLGTLYDGSPACDEVIRSINGVGGRVVKLAAGKGVTLFVDSFNSRLVLDVDLHDLAACAAVDIPLVPPSELPSLSPSDDPCDCGPEL